MHGNAPSPPLVSFGSTPSLPVDVENAMEEGDRGAALRQMNAEPAPSEPAAAPTQPTTVEATAMATDADWLHAPLAADEYEPFRPQGMWVSTDGIGVSVSKFCV